MSSETSSELVLTSLTAACAAGDLPTLKTLLKSFEASSDDKDTAIFHLLAKATEMKHKDIVRYLLDQTEKVDYGEDLVYSALSAGFDIYKLYLDKNPSIWKIEWQGIGDAVCSCLRCHDIECLKYLLEVVGADPGRSLNSTRLGYIFLPIEWVAYSSTESHARLLLKYGAIINGTNALQLAADYGKLRMVRLLVEEGADVNGMLDADDIWHGRSSNPQGTALHYAAGRGDEDIAEYLLAHGADANKLDRFGHTPVERANSEGHRRTAQFISSYHTKRWC